MENDNICETCGEDFTGKAGLKTHQGQWCDIHVPSYITEHFSEETNENDF